MKTTKVIPFYERAERNQFTNFRQTSLPLKFLHILEKLLVHRLDSFVGKDNLLSDIQYSFCTKRSTSMTVMELVAEIITAIDEMEYIAGVFTVY